MFSDEVVQVNTHEFQLQVISPQISATPAALTKASRSRTISLLKSIFGLLPETPVIGLGINCNWRIASENETRGLLKKLFYKAGSPLFNSFSSDDSYFGGYMSKDEAGGRLRLTVRPVQFKDADSTSISEVIDFSFNFHLELNLQEPQEARLELMDRHLEQWDHIVNHTQDIVTEVSELNE